MERRHTPGLGRAVSAIGAGCWTIGGAATNRGVSIGWTGVDEGEALAGLVRAYDLGVTVYDTADVYGLGHSERLVGRLLAQVDRSQIVVSSKVGYFAGTAAHPYQERQILRQFETTRDNLGTGYLDLYFLHSADFGPADRYLDEAAKTVRQLRREGLIGAVGMRAPHEFALEWAADPGQPHGARAARFLDLFDRIQPDVLTVRYNLLSPLYTPAETDVFAFARQRNVGVLMKQVLGQGLLLNAHDPMSPPVFPSDDHRHADHRFAPPALQAIRDGLGAVGRRFGDSRSDLARVALQYALQADPDAVALVGFRNAEQVSSNLASLGKPLTPDDVGEIQRIMSPVRDMLADPARSPTRS
jgi:aryl-alcohol dehydrogenase-like predicted oxidoreductase